jgi:hypothetical protein
VEDRIVLEGSLEAGVYYFSVRLYKGDDLYWVVSKVIQVRTNLRSEKTYTLDWEDLDLTYSITYHLRDTEMETGYYRYTDGDTPLVLFRPGYRLTWYDNPDLKGDPVTRFPGAARGTSMPNGSPSRRRLLMHPWPNH